MIKFLLKVWSLAKPYRTRLFLGVLTGILTGLVSPLVIGTVMFVYSAVFPTTDQSGMAQLPMQKLPVFAQQLVLHRAPGAGKRRADASMDGDGVDCGHSVHHAFERLLRLPQCLSPAMGRQPRHRRLARPALPASAGFVRRILQPKFLRPAHLAGHERHRRAAKHPEQRASPWSFATPSRWSAFWRFCFGNSPN